MNINDFDLTVARRNERVRCRVELCRGNDRVVDDLNPDNASHRRRFAEQAAERFELEASDVDALADAIVAAADDADRPADDAAAIESELARDPPPNADQPRPDSSYLETQEGLIHLRPTTNGPYPEPLSNFTARIVAEVVQDDGVERHRVFEIEAHLGSRNFRFSIPAAKFASLSWVVEEIGAGAVIFAGYNVKEHARTAIQILSGDVPRRTVFTHLGWRQVDDQWVYLHAGGAIGRSGAVAGIEVNPPEALSNFVLPDPASGEELVAAIQASLRILDVAADTVTIPVWLGIWRAVMGPADFALWLFGCTGTGKTELAALAQRHSGQEMDARNLPASWSSTGNALEALAFSAKEALLVVDDFAPRGSQADLARLHRDAGRLVRAQGNRAGRARMRADASLRPSKPPRGLILATGEDLVSGHSARARLLICEHDMIDWPRLTECQRDAEAGVYAAAMAGFLRWLAPYYPQLHEWHARQVAGLRSRAERSGAHKRTPALVAELAAAGRLFLEFARAAGAIDQDESEQLFRRMWRVLGQVAAEQARYHAAADPVARFLELLTAAIVSGHAYVDRCRKRPLENPGACGWSRDYGEWKPKGDRIGWLDGDRLYLNPDAAFQVANRRAGATTEGLQISQQTLWIRLRERHLLLEFDPDHLTARKMCGGSRQRVLVVRADLIVAGAGRSDELDDV